MSTIAESIPTKAATMAELQRNVFRDSEAWLAAVKAITLPADAPPQYTRQSFDMFTRALRNLRFWAGNALQRPLPLSVFLAVQMMNLLVEADFWAMALVLSCPRVESLFAVFDVLNPLHSQIREYVNTCRRLLIDLAVIVDDMLYPPAGDNAGKAALPKPNVYDA